MTKVFISYSRKDITFIEQLAADLKLASVDAWYDLSGLEGGSRWSREIEKAIKDSEYVIVVLSPNSVVSEWVEEEILLARKLKRKIIPLLYKPCDIPLGFHTINFIDVQGGKYQQNYREILRALDIEHSKREVAEKARLASRKAAIEKLLSNALPFLKVFGTLGIIIVLFWTGSLAIPKFIALIPTPQVASTATQLLVTKITSTNPLIDPTKTIRPTSTMTKNPTPTTIPNEIIDSKGVSMVRVSIDKTSQFFVPPFYMDKYEVTNELYKNCVNAGLCSVPTNPIYFNQTSYSKYPVVYVTLEMANSFCSWRDSQLPTFDEFVATIKEKDNSLYYPWSTTDDNDCNYANFASEFLGYSLGYKYCVGTTVPVGSYELGKTTSGIYDLIGNVAEWSGSYILGGSWASYKPSWFRQVLNTVDPISDNTIGFRCAKDAQ